MEDKTEKKRPKNVNVCLSIANVFKIVNDLSSQEYEKKTRVSARVFSGFLQNHQLLRSVYHDR